MAVLGPVNDMGMGWLQQCLADVARLAPAVAANAHAVAGRGLRWDGGRAHEQPEDVEDAVEGCQVLAWASHAVALVVGTFVPLLETVLLHPASHTSQPTVDTAQALHVQLTSPGFLAAMASAVSSLGLVCAAARELGTPPELLWDMDWGCVSLVQAAAGLFVQDTMHVAATYLERLIASGARSTSSGPRRRPAMDAAASNAMHVLRELHSSGLLTATCAALLHLPDPAVAAAAGNPEAEIMLAGTINDAACFLTKALAVMTQLGQQIRHLVLAQEGGAASLQLEEAVACLLAQPEVVALQRAMVERVVVHGGGSEGAGAGGSFGRDVPAGSAAAGGSSSGGGAAAAGGSGPGGWCLIAAEVRRGEPFTPPGNNADMRLLEVEHTRVIRSTFGVWVTLRKLQQQPNLRRRQQPAARAREDAPSPTAAAASDCLPSVGEMAAMSVRVAAALRRLQLGRGLGGSYGAEGGSPATMLLPRLAPAVSALLLDADGDHYLTTRAGPGMVAALPDRLRCMAHLLAMCVDAAAGGKEADRAAQRRLAAAHPGKQVEPRTAEEALKDVFDHLGFLMIDEVEGCPTLDPPTCIACSKQLAADGALLPAVHYVLRAALRGELAHLAQEVPGGVEPAVPLLAHMAISVPDTLRLGFAVLPAGCRGACLFPEADGQVWVDACGGDAPPEAADAYFAFVLTTVKVARTTAAALEAAPLAGATPFAGAPAAARLRQRKSALSEGACVIEDLCRNIGMVHMHCQRCGLLPELPPVPVHHQGAAAAGGTEAGGTPAGSAVAGSAPAAGGTARGAAGEVLTWLLAAGVAVGTQLVRHLAAEQAAGTPPRPKPRGANNPLDANELHKMLLMTTSVLRMLRLCAEARYPPDQLLAVQPQRLVAALGQLLAGSAAAAARGRGSWTIDAPVLEVVCKELAAAVAVMADHPGLQPYVRAWLAPAAVAAEGAEGGEGGAAGEDPQVAAARQAATAYAAALTASSEAGSGSSGGSSGQHEGIVTAGALHEMKRVVPAMGVALATLVAASAKACPVGAEAAAGCEADGGAGGWQGFASAAKRCCKLALAAEAEAVSEKACAQQQGQGRSGPGDARFDPFVLPPPMVPAPLGFRHIKMCCNPRCSSFEGGSEGEMKLLQCGGCRLVRYCGRECQAQHWREGHKAECALLKRSG